MQKKKAGSMIYPKISFLMTAYKEEKVIEGTLKHLMEDVVYPNREVFIAVDTKEDKTYDIVKKFAKKYKTIKINYSPTRRGFLKALNDIVKLSTGKIIVKQDAERRYLEPKECMFRLVKYFEDENVGAVTFEITFPKTHQELKKGMAANAEALIDKIVYGWQRDMHPVVKGEWDMPLIANAVRRDIVSTLPHECDDVEYSYLALNRGLKVVYAPDIKYSIVSLANNTRSLFLQKRRAGVCWYRTKQYRKLRMGKYYLSLTTYFLRNIYKYSLKEIVIFCYFFIVFAASLVSAYLKKREDIVKVWVKYER